MSNYDSAVQYMCAAYAAGAVARSLVPAARHVKRARAHSMRDVDDDNMHTKCANSSKFCDDDAMMTHDEKRLSGGSSRVPKRHLREPRNKLSRVLALFNQSHIVQHS